MTHILEQGLKGKVFSLGFGRAYPMQLLSRVIQSSVKPFCRDKLVIDVIIMTYTMPIYEKYTILAFGTLVPSKCHVFYDDRVSLSDLG